MIRRAPLLACLLALAACRTVRLPSGESLEPLTSNSPEDAAVQLAQRRSEFQGERSLIKIRIPTGRTTIPTRGQLQVDRTRRMLLTLYTPIGTSAARLYADGDEITFLNDLQSTAWRGKAGDLGGGLGLLGVMPAETVALLLVGLPPPDLDSVTYAATGMAEVRLGDAIITYDPPVYPPKRIVLERGGRRLTLERLESVIDADSVPRLEIPRDYRCCELPRM